MSFSITPNGIVAHVPIVVYGTQIYVDLFCSVAQTDYRGGRKLRVPPAYAHAGIVLLSLQRGSDSSGLSQYHVDSRRLHLCGPSTTCGIYVIDGQTVHASWRDVLIRHRLPLPEQFTDADRAVFIPAVPIQLALDAAFRFDEAHIQKFLRESGSIRVEHRNAHFRSPFLEDTSDVDSPTAFIFFPNSHRLMVTDGSEHLGYPIMIKVGQCHRVSSPQQLPSGLQDPSQPVPVLWATVNLSPLTASYQHSDVESRVSWSDPMHDCLSDHVSQWPDLRKWFDLRRAAVTLSFTPCPISPMRTLVMDASYVPGP